MEHYVTLKAFAEKNGMLVGEVFRLGREKDALITINKGSEANIYIREDILEEN